MFGGISSRNRQRLLPVLPVPIFQQDSDRRADGPALSHSRKNVGPVLLDFHASAAPIALLTAPQLTIQKYLVDLQSRRHAGEKCNQGFAVRLPSGVVAEHRLGLYPKPATNLFSGFRIYYSVFCI